MIKANEKGNIKNNRFLIEIIIYRNLKFSENFDDIFLRFIYAEFLLNMNLGILIINRSNKISI